jgi:hypothetical protein
MNYGCARLSTDGKSANAPVRLPANRSPRSPAPTTSGAATISRLSA